ncbi:hypothetical protein [Streptomyces sp. NPDC007205]|uniref:hypothetical protein n=1 Tax=Streptomyces sp. NPDC007205 TaxID=3154316 RepID=UPI0033E39DBC
MQHERPGASRIDVGVGPGLADADSGQWDRLIGPDNFYNSHAWLHALELAHGDTSVITATSGGTLLGALPVWPGENATSGLFHLPSLFPALDTEWSPDYLWLGARRSVYNELICTRNEARPRILKALLEEALRAARDRGRAGIVMPYLAGDDARELACAHPRARVLLHDADASIDIPVGGFSEHLTHMSRRDRHLRRAELRTCERSGTIIKWMPLSGDAMQAAADLVTQNRARHGGTADIGWMRRSLTAQRISGVLRRAIGCFGIRDGRPVAVTICYAHHDRLFARYYGFDYRATQPAGEYFVLSYCAPIDYAATCGFRRYRLAVSAQQLKVRRGASLAPLAAVVLPAHGTACGGEEAAAYNAATARHWREVCQGRPHAMGPEWDVWESGHTHTN